MMRWEKVIWHYMRWFSYIYLQLVQVLYCYQASIADWYTWCPRCCLLNQSLQLIIVTFTSSHTRPPHMHMEQLIFWSTYQTCRL